MIYLFILYILLSIINSQLPKCNENSIKYILTPCDENFKRKIYFSNPEQCDIFTENIPNSNENLECSSCQNGYYLTYNMTTKSLICKMCPKNTYSIGGNFRINGEYNEWNNDIIDTFQNECFVTNSNNDNYYCSNFHTKDGKKLISGNPYLIQSNNNISYGVQLGKTFHLIENGELKFKYKKDTILNEDNSKNGIFKFFINYLIEINDDEVSSLENDYKEIKVNLKPGYYTFLWQYSKKINNKDDENLKISIKNIELTGLETAELNCKECKNGFSNEGSDHCQICDKGQYFDKESTTCKNCEKGYYSKNGIGINSCIKFPNCEDDDYIKIVDDKCNRNNKQKVYFKLINQFCFENQIKNDFEIDCQKCESGFYKKKIDDNYYKCDYCPSYTYTTEDGNFDSCLNCDGITKKKLVFNKIDNNYFNQKFEIENEEGEINIEIDNNQNIESIKIIIDNNQYLKEPINNMIKITLEKGKHEIKINTLYNQIKKVTIYNTKEGGGYKCEECPNNLKEKTENGYTCVICSPGFYYSNSEKKCIKCDENYIKISYSNEDKCIKCPNFTFSNDDRTECVIHKVINQKNIMRSFIIENLENSIDQICKIQNCLYSFYPIKDLRNNDMFYLSFNYSTFFLNQNYEQAIKKKEDNGYIFLAKNNGLKDNRIIYNIGNKIENIKIVDENNNKGIIIQYTGGDNCPENNDKKIESYLFLKCKKNNIDNNFFVFQKPIFIHNDNCNYYFEWEIESICPICLSNEVRTISSLCINSKKNVFSIENDYCLIQNKYNILGNDIEYDSNDNIINENDKDLINIYKLKINSKREYPKNKSIKYITEKKYETSCKVSENYDKFSILFIIIGIIVYLILLATILFIYFKSNKLMSNFPRREYNIGSVEVSDQSIEMKVVKIGEKETNK